MRDKSHGRLIELLLLSRTPEQLNEDQRNELNQLLRDNEESQRVASQFLMDEAGLTELLKTNDIADISAGRSPTQTQTKTRQVQGAKKARVLLSLLGISALLVCVALVLAFGQRGPVAELEDLVDAQFSDPIPENGHLKTHQPYRLLEGMATVRFRNGVLATIKGAAAFDILDTFNVELAEGTIRAVVPESGQGFTVKTPAALVEDLGTEFAVEVDPSSGESEIHVFDGLVHVNSLKGGKLLTALEGGEGIRVDKQEKQRMANDAADRFPAPRDVRFQRWKRSSRKLRQDPDLLCYYTFSSEAPKLVDIAKHGTPIHGEITGAEWVSGRWPGKRALLFDDLGDRVKIEIPGQLKAMGLSAWVYVTDFETSVAPVLNSAGWETGDVHLQLDRFKASFFVGLRHGFATDRHRAKLVQSGRWMHLAVSIDTTTLDTTTWVDGEIASQRDLKPNTVLTPGTCYLGDWIDTREEKYRGGRRSFKGRMDELAIWQRPLTTTEVRRLYRAGSPK